MKELEKFEKKLQKHLDKERYQHTLGVMYTSAALAMAYHYDMDKAMIAGLLHDCAKNVPNEKNWSFAKSIILKLQISNGKIHFCCMQRLVRGLPGKNMM